ncbi:MAG: DUF393 domain-containing protein [Reichenbachiella sp.]
MKTLTNHTIIYDDECPMCNQYTQAFITTGMLDQEGRVAYSEAVNSPGIAIDWDRARNEIALWNKEDNSVLYGVASLTTILGQSLPIFKPLFASRVFVFLMRYLYAFISYNRKEIAPSRVFEGRNACTPDQNNTARWAYIIFAWLGTSFILVHYARLIIPWVDASNYYSEFLICGGQLVFQGIIVMIVKKDRWMHYLGNVITISLAGALLLTPMFLLDHWVANSWVFLGYFILIVAAMFFEHMRRVRILELPWYLTATWVLYRFLVLAIINKL